MQDRDLLQLNIAFRGKGRHNLVFFSFRAYNSPRRPFSDRETAHGKVNCILDLWRSNLAQGHGIRGGAPAFPNAIFLNFKQSQSYLPHFGAAHTENTSYTVPQVMEITPPPGPFQLRKMAWGKVRVPLPCHSSELNHPPPLAPSLWKTCWEPGPNSLKSALCNLALSLNPIECNQGSFA